MSNFPDSLQRIGTTLCDDNELLIAEGNKFGLGNERLEDLLDEVVRRYNTFSKLSREKVELSGRLKEKQKRCEELDEALGLIRARFEDDANFDTISYLEIIDQARGVGKFAE